MPPSMHRHLSRVARRSLPDPRNLPKGRETVQKHAAERTQPSQAFSSSQDYSHFRWRNKLGDRFLPLQVVNALQLGQREKALKILLNFGDIDAPLNADHFAYIMDYCARTPDPMFVMEAWKVMKDKAICLNERCSRLIIRALSKGGYLEEAFNWLTFLGKNENAPAVLPLYNIFLSACGKTQRFIDADRCLQLMEHQLIGKSEITYWELLKLAVLQRNLSAAHELWKDSTTYYNPSIMTLRKFIWAFTELGDLESAYRALEYMVTLAAQRGSSVTTSAEGRYQASRLDIPIPLSNDLLHERFKLRDISKGNFTRMKEDYSGNHMDPFGEKKQSFNSIDESAMEKNSINSLLPTHVAVDAKFDNQYPSGEQDVHVESFIDNLKQQGLVLDALKGTKSEQVINILRWSFSDMIHACAQFKNSKLAEHLFKEMHGLGLKPSPHTYDGFVKAVINTKGVAYGMKLIEEMEERGMKPYDSTLAALSVSLSKNLKLQLAEALLERISDSLPKYIHFFNEFLAACGVMDDPERALHMLAKMKRLNVKSNIRTYEILFSLFGTVNVPYERGNMLSHIDVAKRVKTIEMDMINNGIQHSYSSMKKLIKALGAEGMIQEMLQYLNVAENMLWDTNSYQKTAMYNIVLHSLIEAKESQMAIKVFKNMRICGFPANVATYNIMIECCSILKCLNSAHALVSLMLRDGFCPQTLTYTALIKVFLGNEDFEGTMSLLDLSRLEVIEPDIQLFNTILREAYLKKRIDIIELIVEHIHREKIQPDPSTCCYTFSAYVECGFYSTAMEALQVLSMRMISEDDSILQEQRAAFEDLVLSEDADAESQIIEIFKESQEFIATALLNLRMCAINGSLISWFPDENPWARRLSSCYGAKKGAT